MLDIVIKLKFINQDLDFFQELKISTYDTATKKYERSSLVHFYNLQGEAAPVIPRH